MTLSEYINSIRDKKIAVLGAGVSNMPLVRILRRAGADVTVYDKATEEKLGANYNELCSLGAKTVLGEGYLDRIDGDIIFRSPGIRPDRPGILAAVDRGAVLTSEMEAFFEVCPAPIFAVTGSDGKTTTTTVISEILRAAGRKVWLGGNIGTPLLDKADEMTAEDVCVLELSSFQLMTMKKSPMTAVITNLAPNHLDVHKDMQEYIDSKKNIFIHDPQPRRVVLNADNGITSSFVPEVRGQCLTFSRRQPVENGVFWQDGVIYAAVDGRTTEIMRSDDIFLPGAHNIENYMAAFAALWGYVPAEAMVKTAREFKGVEHRIEYVRTLNGVKFYNDSIASSPSRTTAGLRSFKQKVILIAGGKDKGVPFDSLGAEIKEHVKKLVVTGLTAEKIKAAAINAGADIPIIHEPDFRDAVEAAYRAAQPGDIVILSPACTSFDRFKNFAERGRFFKEIVNGLE